MTNGNDLVYPVSSEAYRQTGINECLTKREYFAAMALQGCISSGFETTMDKHAESAIEAADALIKALNKI